jgi:hypothetical protein
MRKFVCELGGYEVLLRGNASDARRAAVARLAEHGPVTMHDDSLQRAVDRLADWWRTGVLWWGPGVGREAIVDWFTRKRYEIDVGGVPTVVPLYAAELWRARERMKRSAE